MGRGVRAAHARALATLACVAVVSVGCASQPTVAPAIRVPTPYGSPAPLPSLPADPTRLDLAYAGDSVPAHKLDLYLPPDARGPAPVVIWIHGGAWAFGSKAMGLTDKTGFGALRAMLQSRGYAVASLGYRLVDQARFPAQLYDIKAAIRYLRNHAAELGVDPARFVIAGESAGGNLAELAAFTGGMPSLEGDVGEPTGSSAVRAVVSYYGVSDLTRVADDRRAAGCRAPANPEKSGEWRLVGGDPATTARDVALQASPITYAADAKTPALFLHGTRDCIVPDAQSVRMAEALRAHGTHAQLITVPAGHADPGFYTDAGLQAAVLDFLATYDS